VSFGVEYFEQEGTGERNDRAPRFNSYDNFGLFAQNRLRGDRLGVSFGARYDDFNTTFGARSTRNSETSLNLGADAELGAGFSVFVGVGESARGGGTIPIHFAANAVPDVAFNGAVGGRLEAERGRMAEVGLAWAGTGLLASADRLESRLVAYRTRIADPIIYDQPGSGGLGGRPVTEFRNAERAARFSGFELRSRYDLQRAHVSLALARMRTEDLPALPQFLARFGAPLGDRAVLTVGYDVSAAMQLGYTLTAVRRLERVPEDQIVFTPKPGYATHDVFVRWVPARQPAVSVDFAVRNLFDKRHVNHATFTQNGFATEEPGRDLRVTLGYRY
jgi:hemoglobin/transferrin/lactoferrin receptor protein